MPGIFKVSFNIIYEEVQIDKEGGKPIGKPSWRNWDYAKSSRKSKDDFEPIASGSADDDATVAADNAEHAIALVRKAKVGPPSDFEIDDADDERNLKEGDWVRSNVCGIQIVRVEPVAFTDI